VRRTESNFCGSRVLRLEQAKALWHLCRSGIYEGSPIAFQRESCILYRKCTLAKKYNIRLVGQIRLVTRSLRRYAPCPHCIRSAHFNRVRLRVSPSAQDDAFKEVRSIRVGRRTPSRTATPHQSHVAQRPATASPQGEAFRCGAFSGCFLLLPKIVFKNFSPKARRKL